ncbi:MAG: exodeoxyribonuclease V subunit alpha [Parachlamydiaceae bacterium]|nr:exodeoxyribonuclease V subunit alpha [Parachlamydiaceae bacterium]
MVKPPKTWDLLESLAESGHISFIDLSLAKMLLGYDENSASLESAAALICHLSLSARSGHLCVEVDEDLVLPDPLSTWNENRFSEQGLLQEEGAQALLNQVPAMIAKGASQIPTRLLTKVREDVNDIHAVQTPLCFMQNRFYFQRYWFYETVLLLHYKQFISKTPRITFDKPKMNERVKLLEHSKKLLPEQAKAILNACNYTLTIICGGPGTGKTHTAGVLICTIWDALDDVQQGKFEIALAAPTGKAAANLQKSLLRATEGIGKLANLQSKTLHALLGIKGSNNSVETKFLPHDLVIVDESSMVDVRLMAALFAAMKPGARLILLGDGHQLPSVEAGSLFADFVKCQSGGESSRVTSLHKCLRAELKGILDVATAINLGNDEEVIELFEQGVAGIERLSIQANPRTDAAIAREICSYAFGCYQMQDLEKLQPKELLNHFNSFRLLSALRKGTLGVEEINRSINQKVKAALLAKEASRGCDGTRYIAPIMLLKNDYRLELFNGEVGVLVRPLFREGLGDFDFSCGDYAIFMGKDGEIKKVPALLLPSFEFAYCLSVHKSQGSEFDHLLLLLPSGSECFGRELLYTAVTRARRKLTLWTEDSILKATVQRNNHRLSGIPKRLF